VNVNFTQMIEIRTDDPDALVELSSAWDRLQADADVMGYMGSHVLADREEPGRYIIVAEFGVVDPDVSAAEEAARNDDRDQTHEWVAKLAEIVKEPPVYRNFDEIYRTG
jgi:hypothetical protein